MKRNKKSKLDPRIFIFLYCMIVVICGIWYSEYRSKMEITENLAAISMQGETSLEVRDNEEVTEFAQQNQKILSANLPEGVTDLTEEEKIDSSEQVQSDKININLADAKTLATLPGIGEKIAANIITYRDQKGDFTSIEEIMNVDRIGEKTFEKIKDLITVE